MMQLYDKHSNMKLVVELMLRTFQFSTTFTERTYREEHAS